MIPATLEQALQAALAPRDLLTHPFYQAWSAGELRAEDLARYAEQYRFQVTALPELLRRARSLTGDAETESELSRNLDDEEGLDRRRARARLWEAFGAAVGAVAEAIALPETRASAEVAGRAGGRGRGDGARALWAYEVQTVRVADTR